MSYCGGTPCNWEVYYGDEVSADIAKMYVEDEEEASNVDNGAISKSEYKLFVYSKHGHLDEGHRNRIVSWHC